MKVLLSINPRHVANIFNKKKTFEFRKQIFKRKDIKTVVVYCTKPVGCIIGEFDVDCILSGMPEEIWSLTSCGSGISKGFFDAYFSNRQTAYALKIGEVRKYDFPVDPKRRMKGFTAPQSYMYLDSAEDWWSADVSQRLAPR